MYEEWILHASSTSSSVDSYVRARVSKGEFSTGNQQTTHKQGSSHHQSKERRNGLGKHP